MVRGEHLRTVIGTATMIYVDEFGDPPECMYAAECVTSCSDILAALSIVEPAATGTPPIFKRARLAAARAARAGRLDLLRAVWDATARMLDRVILDLVAALTPTTAVRVLRRVAALLSRLVASARPLVDRTDDPPPPLAERVVTLVVSHAPPARARPRLNVEGRAAA
jgi:hypothetical protein